MAEQSGPSVAAIQARQVALAARHRSAADADEVLSDAVQRAHAATVAARERLDAIAAEIDDCVRGRAALAVDTSLGAREVQKLLIAKHREIIGIVAEAQRDDAARQTVLESLRSQYSGPASPP